MAHHTTGCFFFLRFLPLIAAFFTGGCGPLMDGASLLERDIQPPVLYDALPSSPSAVTIRLSEPAVLLKGSLSVAPALEVRTTAGEGSTLRLLFDTEMSPGMRYSLSARVADQAGNTLTFMTAFYGFNPRVPQLQLNEITTQGSSAHPDKVELLALTAGNTAGVTLFEGTADFWSQRKVLPPVEVAEGDYIVVHCKPEGLPEEQDETTGTGECTAEEAIPGAWDFWIEEGSGLSGNNGVISVYQSARGEVLDGFLYSNRTSSSDERYRGFGSSRTLERAEQLAALEQWTASGRLIAPEDAVNPEDSTATRSMCRTPGAADTDSAADWHIVPTSESSFGRINCTAVYAP